MGVLAALLSGSTSGREVIATVGDREITTLDLRTAGAINGDAESVRRALRGRWHLTLLATEARTLLKLPANTSEERAADALKRRLFDPGQVCARIPEARLRQRYEETRWRFIAPPVFTVDDVQVLCCRKPRECQAPEAQDCLQDKRQSALDLRATFKDTMSADAFKAHYETIHQTSQAAFKRYVFYFDPNGGADVHWRLQEVDEPIAKAAANLTPGEVAPLVTTRFGHHIVRLEETRSAIDLTWEDPRTQAILRTELCPGSLLEAQTRYVRDLSQLLPIRLKESALDSAFGIEMKAMGLTGSAPR